MKLLTADIRKKLLRNGKLRQQREQEDKPEPDFWPVVKLFTPDAGCTWLLTEIDPDDPDIASAAAPSLVTEPAATPLYSRPS